VISRLRLYPPTVAIHWTAFNPLLVANRRSWTRLLIPEAKNRARLTRSRVLFVLEVKPWNAAQ